MGKIGAIVQARMSSERFPGKVLYKVAGKPMLQYLLESLRHCTCLDTIIVAISKEESDTPIVDYCKIFGIACYLGPLRDVARRFVEAVDTFQLDAFVRLTGDSPLLDHRLVCRAVEIFNKSAHFDLVTNVLKRSFPIGQSVEVVNSGVFRNTYSLMRLSKEREHVTSYFYAHPENFVIHNFESGKEYSDIQLSVDTPEDMGGFVNIVEKLQKPHWEYTFEDFVAFLANV